VLSLARHVTDSVRVRARGIPALPGDNPVEIAREVLRRNARSVLWAGSGHFRFMWVSDFGKALRGAQKVLPLAYLRDRIDGMITESRRLGRVPSCFGRLRGFDAPYWRGDNLPWLMISAAEYARWTGTGLWKSQAKALQWLLDDYCGRHFNDGLLDDAVTGDWMDTILRPSSTYNNICALKMLQDAAALGLKTPMEPKALEHEIMRVRWRGDHFIDCAEGQDMGVDAGVFTLYFGLFKKETRLAIIRRIEREKAAKPIPIKANLERHQERYMPPLTKLTPDYHNVVWLHLGLVFLNGLKKEGLDYSAYKSVVDGVVMRHRNFIETLRPSGRIYSTWAHSTEYGLSMAAGQYLELVLD
jgi:glycogen debranching enzyme